MKRFLKHIFVRKLIVCWVLCSLLVNNMYVHALAHDSLTKSQCEVTTSDVVNVGLQSLAGCDLKQILGDIIKRAHQENMLEELPHGLIRCYESLMTSMYVHRADLEEALSYLIRLVATSPITDASMTDSSLISGEMTDSSLISGEMTDSSLISGEMTDRAMRPDAPQGASIVGAATCDVTPVLKAISCLRALITNDFNATWTILSHLSFDVTATIDFSGVYSTLAHIDDEFRETWTMIQHCCDEISKDFENTWTILAHVEQELIDCCTQNRVDFATTWTMIQNCCDHIQKDFDGTWTILADLTPCAAMPLSQADVTAGILLIDIPGTYCLTSDIAGTITISADNVTLDLNGHTVQAITATSVDDLLIHNGFVDGGGGTVGIALTSCNNVKIERVDVSNVATGLTATDVDLLSVTTMSLTSLTTAAMVLTTVRNSVFTNIRAENNNIATGTFMTITGASENCRFEDVWLNNNTAGGGWLVPASDTNNLAFINCQVNNNSITPDFRGWSLSEVTDVSFTDCSVNENAHTSFDVADISAFLIFSCDNVVTTRCTANSNDANLSSLNAFFYSLCSNISFDECQACSNIAFDAPALTGFMFNGVSVFTCNACFADLNRGPALLYGFDIVNSTQGNLYDCHANFNTDATDVIGMSTRATSLDMLLQNCEASRNQTSVFGNSAIAFFLDNASSVTYRSCIARYNSSPAGVIGFSGSISGSGVSDGNSYQSCIAEANSTVTGAGVFGFQLTNQTNISILDCIVNGHTNGVTATGVGIQVTSGTRYVISGNVIESNNIGIVLASCSGCSVKQNTIQRNTSGGLSLTSNCAQCIIQNNTLQENTTAGISISPAWTAVSGNTNTFFGNIVQGSGIGGASNYVGFGAPGGNPFIQIVSRYNPSAVPNTLTNASLLPQPLANLSILAP
jgi:parallel beta-helix repeat protein